MNIRFAIAVATFIAQTGCGRSGGAAAVFFESETQGRGWRFVTGGFGPKYAFLSWVAASLLLAAPSGAQARIINALSPSLADVSRAIASAVDGDSVAVPAGTASWTSTLVINKGITLIGKTTTDSVAGTAVDNTIIQDNVARGPGGRPIIKIASALGKSYRLSGFTFAGLSTVGNRSGAVVVAGNSHAVRIDHCHWKEPLAQAIDCAINGAIYGVADHNILEFRSKRQSFTFHADNWPDPNGKAGVFGDGSWAAPTDFGSEKFFFVEDNCIKNTTNPFREGAGSTDDRNGGRWVYRHNHCYNVEVQTHGTETGRYRGGRAREIYNNDFHNTTAHPVGGIRSGVTITHDNTYYGVKPPRGIVLEAYRTFFKWKSQSLPNGWGGATGDNPWDVNDTEGDGTNVPEHSPHLYESGTCSTGSNKTTIVDTTKNWPIDRWVGFTAKRVSDDQVAYIKSNTSDTLTVLFYADSGGGAVWAAGDQYQIHNCLVALDQPGRGKCDLITGTPPRNSTTGRITWPHQALEPSYSWNDKYIPDGTSVNFQPGPGNHKLQLLGRDYYNDKPMPGYTPYTYPHPLTRGSEPPTNIPRPN